MKSSQTASFSHCQTALIKASNIHSSYAQHSEYKLQCRQISFDYESCNAKGSLRMLGHQNVSFVEQAIPTLNRYQSFLFKKLQCIK